MPLKKSLAFQYQQLYSFGGSPDGAAPQRAPLVGPNGVLYGTTSQGGVPGFSFFGAGTVYSLTPPATVGGSWTENVLWSFKSINSADGYDPGALKMDASGNLYGVTSAGGTLNISGIVFELIASMGTWNESILWTFNDHFTDPRVPVDLLVGANGSIVGITAAGGRWDVGTLFSLNGGTFTTLHRFGNGPGDGADPVGLTPGPNGVIFGATQSDPINDLQNGPCGTVFEALVSGGIISEKPIYTFPFSNPTPATGCHPYASVVRDQNGVLYGTTEAGGIQGFDEEGDGTGVVFSLTPPATTGGAWTENVLYTFQTGTTDGAFPDSGVVIGPGGVLYGTTSAGGDTTIHGLGGAGTLFSLTPPAAPGGTWTETILHNFGDTTNDGGEPGGLTLSKGVFYGTTYGGGAFAGRNGGGTVFSVTP